MSNSLWPHGLQHARFPCLSLSPGVFSDSYLLSWWCYPTISSSVSPFSSSPQFQRLAPAPGTQSFPESGSFPMSHLFASGSQIFGASASASVFQWIFKVDFLWDWIVWSPSSKELSRVFSSTIGKHQSSALSPPYSSPFTSVRDYWKNHSFDYTDVKLMKSLVLTLIMLF